MQIIVAPNVVPKDDFQRLAFAKESPHSASRVAVGEVFSNFLDFTGLATELVGHSTRVEQGYYQRAIANAMTTGSTLEFHRAKTATCFPKIQQ